MPRQIQSATTRILSALIGLVFAIHAAAAFAGDFEVRDNNGDPALRIDADGNVWIAGQLQQNQALGTGSGLPGWSVRAGGERRSWLGLQPGTLPVGTLRLSGAIHPTTNTGTALNPAYVIRDPGKPPKAVFHRNGDLSLAGRLFENSIPIKDCRPEAGVVQFALSKFETEEGASAAQILVARTGGTTGTVTVHYQTADATAHAGEDYVATNGTLTLASGDAWSTFTVQILSNPAIEGTESVRLELSNPQGGCRLGAVSRADLVIHELPPEPSEVAGAIDATVPTRIQDAARFIYDPPAGQPPIQTGVTSGTIESARAAVMHGTVYGRTGETTAPLAGVTVSILEHPELGQTMTRANGSFDMVVNGGGTLAVCFEKSNWLKVCRRTRVQSRDWCVLDAVLLTPKTRRYHYVDLLNMTAPTVVSLEAVADADGQRRSHLLFRPGTQAELVPANDVQTTPVHGLNIYFNEYTVGNEGEAAMPADLDPAVAYTHCFEIGVLEAEAANAPMVHFDRPVIYYVNNFLGYPVGMNAPSGTFNRAELKAPGESDARPGGNWTAEPNGRVIRVLSVNQAVTPAQAVLDVMGTGQPATSQQLAAIGIDEAELAKLAELYAAGDELWRVPLTHFTFPKDINWPIFFILRLFFAPAPSVGILVGWWMVEFAVRNIYLPYIDDVISGWGSIDVPKQIMRESVPVAGTSYSLNWSSDRAAGWRGGRQLTVPLVGDSVPPDLVAVRVVVEIGGSVIKKRFEAPFSPNQSWTFNWEGLDGWGRPIEGWQRAKVKVGSEWPGFYGFPKASFEEMQAAYNYIFGLPSDPALFNPANYPNGTGKITRRITQATWREYNLLIAPTGRSDCGWFAQGQGIGGWTLNVHHAYDPERGMLLMGDGERMETGGFHALGLDRFITGNKLVSMFGMDFPYTWVAGMDVGADGSLYIADSHASVVWRVINPGKPGHERYGVFAGNGQATGDHTTGDGGPAIGAQLIGVSDVAVGPNGCVYVTQGINVRRIDRDGIIRTVAGSGWYQSNDPETYNGRRALDIKFGPHSSKSIERITVGPDGSLYILQWARIIYRVDPSGRIYHFAGSGASPAEPHEDVPAVQSLVSAMDMDMGPDGLLYYIEPNRIRRIDSGGIVRTVAGGIVGTQPNGGDGSLAADAFIQRARFLEVADDGAIYFLQGPDSGLYLRTVTASGRVFTIAGNGATGYAGDGGPASRAALGVIPCGLALDRKGTVYLSDRSTDSWPHTTNIARIQPVMPTIDAGDILVPDSSAGVIYRFSEQGRHLATLDASNYQPVLTFDYDTTGRLESLTDAFGNIMRIERNRQGLARSMIGPWDQVTSLTLDSAGRLSAVDLPGGRRTSFAYGSGDMLTTVTGPRLNAYGFDYDENGLLVLARDPVGGATSLRRTGIQNGSQASGQTVITSTSLGVTSSHAILQKPDGTYIQVLTGSDNSITTQTYRKDLSATIVSSDGSVHEMESGPSARKDMGLLYPIQTLSRVRIAGLESLTTHAQTVTYHDFDHDPADFEQTDTISSDGKVSRATIGRPDSNGRREITALSPTGRQSRAVVDEWNRPLEVETPGLAAGYYEYDETGRLITLTTGEGGDARSLHYDFNNSGLVASITDPIGRQALFQYNGADQLTTQTLPGGARISYEYDASGNMTALSPPGRAAYRFEFSPRGEATASRAPETGHDVIRTYDLDRRLARTDLPGGESVSYDYDAAGRLAATHTPRAIIRNHYDAVGRLAKVGDGATTFSYQHASSLLTSMRIDGPSSGTFSTVWGEGLRAVAARLCDGTTTFTLPYAQDDDNLPTQIGALRLRYQTDNAMLASAAVGDAASTVSTSYIYNDFGEPVALAANRLFGLDSTSLHDADFTRDKLGRITHLSETFSGENARSLNCFYDTAGRLRATNDGATTLSTYTYDANGNRLSRWTPSGGTTSYSYNALDRLTNDSLGNSYQYNANGQLTTRTLAAERTVYRYDALGELFGVNLPDGRRVDYTLDAFGRRLERKINGTRTDLWLYGDGGVPAAKLEGGRVRDLYVYGLHGHVPDYLVRFATDGTSSTWRLITDHRASVRMVVNVATGAIGQRLDYDDFGRVTADSSPGFQPFGFAGGLYDTATRLVHFGARDYDPETGRWTTLDPIGFDGGLNLYGYCVGDPVNQIDPEGLFWIEAANYSAGIGDSMTFGATNWVRELMGINEVVNDHSGWYHAGELTEIAVEIGLTAGAGYLKHAAGNVAAETARTNAKPFLKALHSQAAVLNAGKAPRDPTRYVVAHINPLRGHPGGTKTVFQTRGLPAWAHSGSWNTKLMTQAEHLASHRHLREMESVYRKMFNWPTVAARLTRDGIQYAATK